MSNIVKKDSTNIDNFAGWEDGVEGDDQPQNAGIIQGNLVKFSNEAIWVTRDVDELSADLELVAVDVASRAGVSSRTTLRSSAGSRLAFYDHASIGRRFRSRNSAAP